jgi:hypothetical protein
MNEKDFSRKICQSLDQAPLSPRAAHRLASARENALAAANFQAEGVLAMAGQRVGSFWRHHHGASLAILMLLAALLLAGGWQWQRQRSAEMAIDAQLLADELPIEAFLTDRFDLGGRP